LLVATVYRFRGHYEGDYDLYRPKEEKEMAMAAERDPISRLECQLASFEVDTGRIDSIKREVEAVLTSWSAEARRRPFPEPESARSGVYVGN
jgi:pyruvate dehydrogenase E1 component alpha subunit